MAEFNGKQGIWRTIGGRRVFIEDGDDLKTAMEKSGKFKNMRKDIQDNVKFKDIKEDMIKRQGVTSEEYQRAENNVAQLKKDNDFERTTKQVNEEYNKLEKEYEEREKKIKSMNPNDKNYDVERNHLESQQRDLVAKIRDNEIENSIKSLFIYQDEPTMGTLEKEPLKKYYDNYGKENVDRVWKQMDKKYDVIKGVSMDSEGLRYNTLIEKDKYSPEAIQYYKNAVDTAYKNFSYNTSKYNEAVDRAKKDFENYDKINPTYEDDIDKIMSRYSAGTLRQKYSGTVDYLQKTTNMNGAEILELLKKIEEDKR